MLHAGFIYILVNPALDGYLKIGKTTRDPAERAKELSLATGVPHPFVVAYEKAFSDCHRAEQFVHTYLARKGFRVSESREFFRLALSEAIQALHVAHEELEAAEVEAAVEIVAIDDHGADAQPVWLPIFQEAEDHYFGHREALQDYKRALSLYEQAARLGASWACIRLAEMNAAGEGCTADEHRAVEWLRKGAEAGVIECWSRMAEVFAGNDPSYIRTGNLLNARKCWRRFFAAVDPGGYERGATALFYSLSAYAAVISDNGGDEEDRQVVCSFSERFIEALNKSSAYEHTWIAEELKELTKASTGGRTVGDQTS